MKNDGPSLDDDLVAFGFAKREEKKQDEFEIFEECEDVFRVFLAMLTQFTYAGMGSIVGFNYGSLAFVMDILKIVDKSDCFWKFRRMEHTAITLLKEVNSDKRD